MEDPNRGRPFSHASVLGTTAWGTTLAVLLARNGIPTSLIARTDEEAQRLQSDRKHSIRLPGVAFPQTLTVTADSDRTVADSDLIVVAVPSQTVRLNARRVADAVPSRAIVVSGVKGLELGTGLRMSSVILSEVPASAPERIAVLSGPNLSQEVARGLPASTAVACVDLNVARRVQLAFMSTHFRVYGLTDVVGVEFGGALKNIIAIGAGMGDGLGFGANAKAAFMTRGLAEIARLGSAHGADLQTFSGLAGLGDLVATCISPLSRNRRLGESLARGQSLDHIRQEMHEVAEGVDTTRVALDLAHRCHVDMPIAEMTARVLFERLDPKLAVEQLMAREATTE